MDILTDGLIKVDALNLDQEMSVELVNAANWLLAVREIRNHCF